MARPPKEPQLRMNTDIRIPVTAEQKRLISTAVKDEPGGMAAWARQILLQAAGERISQRRREECEVAVSDSDGFLNEVYRLSQADRVHAAGDLIFDFIHGLLRRGDYSACDHLLLIVEPARLRPALMVTFLSTTLNARQRLKTRDHYFQRALDALAEEHGPERAAKLLEKYR